MRALGEVGRYWGVGSEDITWYTIGVGGGLSDHWNPIWSSFGSTSDTWVLWRETTSHHSELCHGTTNLRNGSQGVNQILSAVFTGLISNVFSRSLLLGGCMHWWVTAFTKLHIAVSERAKGSVCDNECERQCFCKLHMVPLYTALSVEQPQCKQEPINSSFFEPSEPIILINKRTDGFGNNRFHCRQLVPYVRTAGCIHEGEIPLYIRGRPCIANAKPGKSFCV